jgi:hypothetical protein
MNTPLLCAAIISALACGVHVTYGGLRIHKPLLQSNASRLVCAVGSVVWHATTAMMLLNALALLYASSQSAVSAPLVVLVTAQYLATAALFVIYGLSRFGSLLVLPHWIAFLAMAVLAFWGIGGGAAIY